MREALYNQRFGDIYFSPEDGLAETRHVFLRGNGLPARWEGRDRFTIAETGFGTGLNFLAAWKLFEETAQSGQTLDYISFEMYPLASSDIAAALEGWGAELSPFLERFLALYPLRVPGFHRLQISPRVTLTLIFDDVNAALPQLCVPGGVDAWFLDGFAPSKNPQMWTDSLYQNMARLSAEGASAATFTVAGHVRRGLAAAGFAVEKRPGFGRKKEMSAAIFAARKGAFEKAARIRRVAIVGGGLAGTACAHVLAERGVSVTIFEKAGDLAAGASGNETGLFNPRFSAQRGPESDFYTAGFAQAVRTFSQMKDISFRQDGTLHLANTPEKEKRFRSLSENWGWPADHLHSLSPEDASEAAGAALGQEALFLPDAGSVSPRALCHEYAAEAEVRPNAPVTEFAPGSVNGEAFDAVIIACAHAARAFTPLSWLPIHTVRGQVSHVKASAGSACLQKNICYGGYISAARDGGHVVGATFQKWLDDTDVKEADHGENLAKLAVAIPSLGALSDVRGGKAGLRTASKDHFPLIGPACDVAGQAIPGVYLSLAHGSHGILSTLAGAHLLADMLLQTALSLPEETVRALAPGRFPNAGKPRA